MVYTNKLNLKGIPPKYFNAINYRKKNPKNKKIAIYRDLWKKTPNFNHSKVHNLILSWVFEARIPHMMGFYLKSNQYIMKNF